MWHIGLISNNNFENKRLVLQVPIQQFTSLFLFFDAELLTKNVRFEIFATFVLCTTIFQVKTGMGGWNIGSSETTHGDNILKISIKKNATLNFYVFEDPVVR